MNEFFTDSQREAAYSRGGNLIVSASAGTGKTTVMIERVASLIREGAADVTNILVVTFTNLAAAEMKRRLFDTLASGKSHPRIALQLEKFDFCSISTLHSFCSEVLRNYFYAADVDPSFTVLDEVTASALKKNAYKDVFEEYYSKSDETFAKLYSIFATKRREENFKSVLDFVYDFSRSIPNFYRWYEKTRENFLSDSASGIVYSVIAADITDNLKENKITWENAAVVCREKGYREFAEICSDNSSQFFSGQGNLEQLLKRVSEITLCALPRRNAKKTTDIETEEQLRALFACAKEDTDAFVKKYSSLAGNKSFFDLANESKASVVYVDKLIEIIFRFEEKYAAAKKQRGMLDFNDLELLTLKVLEDKEAAESLKSKYAYVFVDEYQDINRVQEEIINSLTSGGNLFTVGDVKQSIYGFRGCEPSLFVSRYDNYLKTGSGKTAELNDNFRSVKEILNFVNTIFKRTMTRTFGQVDYLSDAMLKGTFTSNLHIPPVRIDIAADEKISESKISAVYDISRENVRGHSDYARAEGRIAAARIKELVGTAYSDGSGKKRILRYGDIAVLSRSMTESAAEIYDCLVAANIPVSAIFRSDGLKSKEVRELVNLMRVIDNPYDDVAFAGACLSPFGKFSENELSEVVCAGGKHSLYRKLLNYVGTVKTGALAGKCCAFLDLTEQLRFFSMSARVDGLILKILELTDFHLYVEALPNGQMRLRRLYAFTDGLCGKRYAESVRKFLSYLDEADADRVDSGAYSDNAVKMMSVHASKGLEFPAVLIVGTSAKFVNDGNSVVCDADIGIAIRHYDFSRMKVEKTLSAAACGMHKAIKQREEEMRLLYVALTRAKNFLVIVSGRAEKFLTTAEIKSPKKATSHIEWILGALKSEYGGEFKDGFCRDGIALNVLCETAADEAVADVAVLLGEQDKNADEAIKSMEFVYPFERATVVPTKVASSSLDRDYYTDDETESEYVPVLYDEGDVRRLTGTAYHKVLERADLSFGESGIAAEISNLVSEGIIDLKAAANVDPSVVYNVLRNPLLLEILQRGKVYRELPFMLKVPYKDLVGSVNDTEQTILQGIIDLLVLGDNYAAVVDYKYTVKKSDLASLYKSQMESYRLAVKRICDIDNVECYILSISDNRLIQV